jgi:hypothetical protein
MRSSATLLLCLLAGPAMAASCDQWTASMEEDEGGPRMMATICAGSGDREHALLVQCGAEGTLNLRFLPAPAISYPPMTVSGGFQARLTFTIDQESFAQNSRLEEMDGAMAMDVPIKDPLIEAMMTHKTVVLTDADGKIGNITFTLNSARKALAKVIDACGA